MSVRNSTVYIGVPAGRAQIATETATSLMVMANVLSDLRHPFEFATVAHADVVTARNLLAHAFLESGAAIFVGLDDDVGVTGGLFRHLFSQQLDFVGTYLPQRQINLDRYAAAIQRGLTGRDAQFEAAPYVGPQVSHPDLAKGHIFAANMIGTGFYILRRHVLEAMLDKDLVVRQAMQLPSLRSSPPGFFNPISTADQYLSEDYSFCHRVREAGYPVHAYIGPGVSHTGLMTFRT